MLEKLIHSKEKHMENCWEFFTCPEEKKSKCRVFISGLGKDCWLVSRNQGNKNFENCIYCPWFRKNNPEYVNFFQSKQ